MAVSKTRVKVSRETLIERISDRIALETETFLKESATYQDRMVTFLNELSFGLDQKVAELGALKPGQFEDYIDSLSTTHDRNGGRCVSVKVSVDIPGKPTIQVGNLERMLRVLEASSDETISIAADDQFARYL